MSTQTSGETLEAATLQFGDLVVAAFDIAAQHSTDPLEVSRLATLVVGDVLGQVRETSRHRKNCGGRT